MTGRWPRLAWRWPGTRQSRSCPLTRVRSPTLEASRARVTTGDLLLTNARLVMRDETVLGTVLVIDGLIAEVDRDRSTRPGAVDLNGDYVVPVVVELHTDALDKHALPRPGMRWPETAAVLAHDAQLAAAGITTVLDSLAVGYLVDAGQRPTDPRP